MSDFVHLHVHSHFSLLDGLNSPSELVEAAKSLGQTAIAITDHGSLAGHRELQRAAGEAGLKPILGLEAYISATDRFDKRTVKKRDDNTQVYNHICLIAKNQNGLENLHTMSRLAWTEGYYYKPRIDMELLEQYGDDIIVLTGCLNGIPAKAIENEDLETASKFLKALKNRFEDDLYIEVQPHNPVEINEGLLALADAGGIKPAVTADCHYANPEDRALEDMFLILSTNPKVEADYKETKGIKNIFDRLNTLYPDRFMTFEDIDVYVSGRADIQGSMEKQDFTRKDIYESTVEIADKIGDFDYPTNLDLLPSDFPDPSAELEKRVLAGLKSRGIDDPEYYDRVQMELGVIRKKNFAPYFLIVEDVVSWAKGENILVGPGRGSGAGSLVLYALGVTEVDPIKYNLLFARFLNEERNDWPDVDIDFEDSRRGEVKEYARKKYKHVANISTYNYFKDKGVIRDAARVFRVPVGETNKMLKKVADFNDFEQSTNEAVINFRNKYPEVLEVASQLRGKIRGSGMHAGGVVISKEPIEQIAPIESAKDPDSSGDRVPVVALDMNDVEEIGLIKFDFLGLKTLSVVHKCIDEVKRRHGVEIDPLEIPLDDPGVYETLSAGHTTGVFQCDAAPYRRLLKTMGVDSFDELVASNALVRPGAMDTVGAEYIARKQGKLPVNYPHEILKPILEDTYGTIIYQEQVMQTVVKLGGLSWSDADKMRKVIGKKRDASEFDVFKDKFIKGATEHISTDVAEKLWHDFEAHAGYSFNKSHAVAYSMLSVWTAYLKNHYPVEYVWSLLVNEGDRDKLTEYFIEARRLGVPIKLPHINRSKVSYYIESDDKLGDCIRIGLSDIKYVGKSAAKRIIQGAPYYTYERLQERASEKYSGVSTRVLDSLNAVGAASAKDNLKTGKESENFYDYLRIPKFNTVELPEFTESLIMPLDDFDETGSFIIRALVRSIRRGKGWSLLDLVDETGTGSVFHKEATELEPGQLYVMLVSNNRIINFTSADDLSHGIEYGSEDPLVRYLAGDVEFDKPGEFVVQLYKRRTKGNGRLMGHLIVADSDFNMKEILVFPKTFSKVFNKIKPGTVQAFSTKHTNDGSNMLLEVQ